jgi:hypothetical protein
MKAIHIIAFILAWAIIATFFAGFMFSQDFSALLPFVLIPIFIILFVPW